MAINAGSIIAMLDLDTGEFSTKLGKAQKQTDDFASKLKGYGNAFEDLGKGLTLGITAPVVGLGAAATNTAMNFESGMSRVQAIAGATESELGRLTEQALQLGADTAFSASEAAAGMENLASAGFSVKEIMAAMPGLLDLAAVSGGDVGLAAEVAANAINGFGLEANKAGHIADVFARAAADTNAEVLDMGEAMKYIAPVAKSMGMSIEETAAAIGLLSDAGIKGGQAGTVLRGALTRLVNPSKEAAETMESLGMSFFDAEGNMIPLSNIITVLQDKTTGLTQEQKNQALAVIFGQEALSGMLALVETGPDRLDELTSSFKNSDGAAKSMAETILNNGKGSVEEMMGALETAAIKIGSIIIPKVTSLAEKVGDVADWFSNLNHETQETIVKLAGLAAAVGPVLLVGGKLASGLGSIIGLFNKFGTGAKVATTAASVLGGSSGLGSVVATGSKAGGVIASLGGAAGTGGALGGLTSGLGASLAAINPWILGLGAATLAGGALYVALNEELIPAVKIFDETTSESTKNALGAFLEMEEKATIALNQLAWSGATVTEEMKINITTNINEMADEVISKLEEQKNEGLAHLQEMLDRSTTMSEEEKEEAIRIATEKYDTEILKATEGKARVEEILTLAKENNRKITDEERVEIETILTDLKNNSILTMTENQTEQETILTNLKNNAIILTAEMAAEVVKNSLTQKEQSIANAEEEYQERLRFAETLKRDGSEESIELANKVIEEAKMQKDESIKAAKEMHANVVIEAKKQASEHVNEVDWETGEIMSLWDKAVKWFKENPIIKQIFTKEGAVAERNDRLNPMGTIVGNNAQGTEYWRGGPTWVGEQGPELIELPRGSKVYSNERSMDMVRNSTPIERKSEIHLHIGTLVADDYGLKQLERKLKDIRIIEDKR